MWYLSHGLLIKRQMQFSYSSLGYVVVNFMGLCCVVYFSANFLKLVTRETTANQVTEVLTALFSRYFFPRIFVSGNEPCFVSEPFKMLSGVGKEHHLVTAFWPQADGAMKL
jgi:hypothetical protein